MLRTGDRRFIEEQLDSVNGWLLPDASYLTSALLNLQQEKGIQGPVFEIGVWEGKYLALLYHHNAPQRQLVLGIDIDTDRLTTVEANFRRLFGSPEVLSLHALDSHDLTPRRAFELLQNKRPRFISVDGDHNASGVHSDLVLATSIVEERGIIGIDDFLNPNAIGVSEGVYQFFAQEGPRDYIPFAWAGNKLFVCQVNQYELYHDASLRFTSEHPDLDMNRQFDDQKRQGTQWVDQPLLGKKCFIFHRLEASEADHSALNQRLAESEARRSELEAVRADLTKRLVASEADRAARLEVILSLQQQTMTKASLKRVAAAVARRLGIYHFLKKHQEPCERVYDALFRIVSRAKEMTPVASLDSPQVEPVIVADATEGEGQSQNQVQTAAAYESAALVAIHHLQQDLNETQKELMQTRNELHKVKEKLQQV